MLNLPVQSRTNRYHIKRKIGLTAEPKKLIIRPYKLIELATLYGTCPKTFKKWIEPYDNEIGERIGYFYNINQVMTIFERLTPPSFLEIE